ELLCGQRRKTYVKREHQCAVESGRGEQAQLRALVGETEKRIRRTQKLARVRLERDRDRRNAERRGARDRCVDHRAMAAMYAIEVSDRRDRAAEARDVRRVIA